MSEGSSTFWNEHFLCFELTRNALMVDLVTLYMDLLVEGPEVTGRHLRALHRRGFTGWEERGPGARADAYKALHRATVDIYIYIYIYIHTRTYLHIYMYTHMHAYMHMYLSLLTPPHVYICTIRKIQYVRE